MKHSFLKFVLFTAILIFEACKEDNILIPTPCLEEGNFSYQSITLELYTGILNTSFIQIFPNGHVQGDSIKIKNNNSLRTAQISGYICKDYKAAIDLRITDTADNSRLKIETYLTIDRIEGKIYWCPNINNQCQFTQIGNLSGLIGGNHGGIFITQLFYGSYRAYLN